MFSNVNFLTVIGRLLLLAVASYFIYVFYKVNYEVLKSDAKINGKFSYKELFKVLLIPVIISLIFTVYYFYVPTIDEETRETIRPLRNNDSIAFSFFSVSFISSLFGSIKGYIDGLSLYKKNTWREQTLNELSVAFEKNDLEAIEKAVERAISQILIRWFAGGHLWTLNHITIGKEKPDDELYKAFLKGWEDDKKERIYFAEKEVVKTALEMLISHREMCEKFNLPFIPSN
jgi:hypothetical protein